jgi:hypothetical protein
MGCNLLCVQDITSSYLGHMISDAYWEFLFSSVPPCKNIRRISQNSLWVLPLQYSHHPVILHFVLHKVTDMCAQFKVKGVFGYLCLLTAHICHCFIFFVLLPRKAFSFLTLCISDALFRRSCNKILYPFSLQNGSGSHPASYPMALSLGEKWLGHEADHSPPSSAEINNAWSYTSTPPIHLHGMVLS